MIILTSCVVAALLLYFFQVQALYYKRYYGKKTALILYGIVAIGFIAEIIYQIITHVHF